MISRRFLFARFLEKEILLEQGRLMFSLLNAFASTGYEIRLFDNLPPEDLGKYGRLVPSLKNLTLTNMLPSDKEDWIYLFDKEDKATGNHSWRKKVQVRYNIFSPYWFKKPIIMPFPVHPVHATPDLKQRLEEYRSSNKCMRVFFSGDTKGYTRNRIQYPKAKLPRPDVIDTILGHMDEDVLLVKDPSVLNDLCSAAYVKKCVIVDTNETWIDDRIWLTTLARTDFFISPPGISLPMCHNVIEAMAVGSIPITNYPEWFDPGLTHMENCIVFDDRDDLIDKLKTALEMNEEQITRMRLNVLDHYETYIKPDTFVHRVESSKDKKITILMLTESNVAYNVSKLNKDSILMRGTISSNDKDWIKRLSQHVFMRH
jgi:hypothetical protein